MYAVAPVGGLPYGMAAPYVEPPPPGPFVPSYGMYGVSPIAAGPCGTAPPYVAQPVPAPELALFLSSRAFDSATITGSSEVSTLPVSYLKDSRVEKKWRTVSKVDQWLSIALEKAEACDTVAISGGNLSAAAVCRVMASNWQPGLPLSPEFDTGWVSAWPVSGKPHLDEAWPVFTNLIRFTNLNAFRYWRLYFADPSIVTTYTELGRVLIGKAFRPTYNVDVNPAIGLESSDVRRRSTFNRTFTDPRGAPSRRMALSLSAVDQDEMRADLFELQRYCGLARDFVFSLDPAATAFHHLYTMQALFVEGAQFEAQPLWDAHGEVWRTSLQLTEPL
jgi:hypothetical protein